MHHSLRLLCNRIIKLSKDKRELSFLQRACVWHRRWLSEGESVAVCESMVLCCTSSRTSTALVRSEDKQIHTGTSDDTAVAMFALILLTAAGVAIIH